MLNYNLPWGWWNFNYTYSQSEYRSQAQANGFNFKQTGDSENHQLRAERVIHRDAVSKTSLSTGLSYLRTNNFIEDSKLKLSSNRLSEAQFGINHGRRTNPRQHRQRTTWRSRTGCAGPEFRARRPASDGYGGAGSRQGNACSYGDVPDEFAAAGPAELRTGASGGYCAVGGVGDFARGHATAC
jgi:hypothetical protein